MKEPLESAFPSLKNSLPFLWADEIWLMGVWKNSPKSQSIARSMPQLQPGFQTVKYPLLAEDVYGSPYAIYSYTPDPLVSSKDNLTNVYKQIHEWNKKLILDFVPNHMAIDSPLIDSNPHLFLIANESVSEKNSFLHPNGYRYVHGRDPYFDGWTDTVQWDFSNPDVEQKHIQILKEIAKVSDGVRCDMAMLLIPDVFEKTHEKKSVYDWKRVIDTVRQDYPNFKFYAEAYWGTEDRLLGLGFDSTYDKSIYDALKENRFYFVSQSLKENAMKIKIRFLENHDEERAKHQFGENSHAYFSLLSFSECILLFHEGQNLGLNKKIPVQMIQTDPEQSNPTTEAFYNRALETISKRNSSSLSYQPNYKEFNGSPIFIRSIETGNQTELILWNESNREVSGWIPFQEGIQFQKSLTDLVAGVEYPQTKSEEGIYFKLKPNQVQWFIF
ncbi:alpha-amylase [Leptospira sp. 2 VSF19]|uniref:Alpha-amylase n=1 Tax=Leptospira soteropolitanensis TaxID=2950025 RepID=A0AAW5VME6_9LEPT|nr:alpha-amylase [Leptospira soteropolitanensis]MCW7493747.1 alpha-amylase [Leptospira soteropolitanensis]MCW7501345.1 alpha-amylase [Leptospira soteropolitanensis]MCW7523469.1 alpha-amylase [Leptospira soteropolitanensis]MCW7527459.1 alpha-amylase [Leptospira soteropolitanensis]MCW7531315.1 alpha-amylase [Leptospira soteropolitanensis]